MGCGASCDSVPLASTTRPVSSKHRRYDPDGAAGSVQLSPLSSALSGKFMTAPPSPASNVIPTPSATSLEIIIQPLNDDVHNDETLCKVPVVKDPSYWSPLSQKPLSPPSSVIGAVPQFGLNSPEGTPTRSPQWKSNPSFSSSAFGLHTPGSSFLSTPLLHSTVSWNVSEMYDEAQDVTYDRPTYSDIADEVASDVSELPSVAETCDEPSAASSALGGFLRSTVAKAKVALVHKGEWKEPKHGGEAYGLPCEPALFAMVMRWRRSIVPPRKVTLSRGMVSSLPEGETTD